MKKWSFRAVVAVCATALPIVVAPVLPAPSVGAAPPPGASAYTPISPTRLADTRPDYGASGFTRLSPDVIRVKVAGRAGIPANATAAALNIVSEGAVTKGFATVFPSGTDIPPTSTLNVDLPGRTIANMTTVQLGVDGSVDIYANTTMNLIVDVAGAYTPVADDHIGRPSGHHLRRRAAGARHPDTPARRWRRVGTQFVSLAGLGVPSDAIAVVVNIIAIDASVGYWTAFPQGEDRPNASNLNIDVPWQIRSSQAIVRMPKNATGFQVFSQSGGHLAVDVAGWFTGPSAPKSTDGLFVPTNPIRVLDTRGASVMPPWGGSTFEFGSGTPLRGPDRSGGHERHDHRPAVLRVHHGLSGRRRTPAGVEPQRHRVRPDHRQPRHRAIGHPWRVAVHAVGHPPGRRRHRLVPGHSRHQHPAGADQPVARDVVRPGHQCAGRGRSHAGGVRHRTSTRSSTPARAGLWAGEGGLGTPEHNVVFAHRTSHGGPFRYINALVGRARRSPCRVPTVAATCTW